VIEHWWVFARIGRSALLQAALYALAAWVATGAANLILTRKRIAWRVYMDAEVSLHPKQARNIEKAIKAEPAGPRMKFRVYIEKPHSDPEKAERGLTQETEVKDPSLVLLRIRNSGFVPISGEEFEPLLKFRFPGRRVRGAHPIETADNLREQLLLLPEDDVPPSTAPPATGLRPRLLAVIRQFTRSPLYPGLAKTDGAGPKAEGKKDFIRLSPTVRLNAKDRITALLVLSGKPAEDGERVERPEGKIFHGKIYKERPRTGPIPVSRRTLLALAIPVALIGLIVGQLASQPASLVVGAKSCAGGRLTLIGSTAFAPVATTIATAYHTSCPTASITVAPDSNGSIFGLTTLANEGKRKAASVIAMSDGPAPSGSTYTPLRGKPIAIIIFTVVVNKGIGLRNLTSADIEKMFGGVITNWSQLGGPHMPVRLVSREFGSGTRRAFDTEVLRAAPLDGTEPSPTSFDCRNASAPVILCALQQTSGLLAAVGTIPGALGYAQTGDVAAEQGGGVQPVALDGLSPTFGNIGRSAGQYPFWTVEYLYTYGEPTGLAKEFLQYLGTPTAVSALEAAEYTPCPADHHGRAWELCTEAGSS
jgi:phosphate transport system substrate-binding protein